MNKMARKSITLPILEEESGLNSCNQCDENGCSVRLDRMPDRVVFRPDQADVNEPRADCSIFFPDEDNSSENLYRRDGGTEPKEANYLAIVELKNTASKPSRIKKQIEGAIDFSIELLKECSDPPWDVKCVCLIAKKNVRLGHKSIKGISIKKNVRGNLHIFRPVPIDSDESLRDVLKQKDVANSVSKL